MASEHQMKRIGCAAAAILFASISLAFGDAATEQVQRALKDQGFYYGEITGQIDADTTAAIRRFQIRNGLKVTGELDGETRKSLGVSTSSTVAKSTPAATAAPQTTTAPETSDLRDQSPTRPEPPAPRPVPAPNHVQPSVAAPNDTEVPVTPQVPNDAEPPVTPPIDTSALFQGTPYELAPPQVQQRVVVGVQSLLMRAGYYRSGIDGLFGPGTAAALRLYQSRVGLEPSGRLDMDTLGALGLLPEQNRRPFPARRRLMRPAPPIEFTPDGQPIYVPR